MSRDYWQSCKEFLPGFFKRAGVFLGIAFVTAVDVLTRLEPYLPFEFGSFVPPPVVWTLIGFGILWAAVATYHAKASDFAEASIVQTPAVEPEPARSDFMPDFGPDRDERRAEKLREWQEAVEESSGRGIFHTSEWSQMRVYLDEAVVKDVEGVAGLSVRPTDLFTGRNNPTVKQRILDGLAELERQWDLL